MNEKTKKISPKQQHLKWVSEIPELVKYVKDLHNVFSLEEYNEYREPLTKEDFEFLSPIEQYRMSSGYKWEYREFRCSSSYNTVAAYYDEYLSLVPHEVLWYLIKRRIFINRQRTVV